MLVSPFVVAADKSAERSDGTNERAVLRTRATETRLDASTFQGESKQLLYSYWRPATFTVAAGRFDARFVNGELSE